MRHYIPWIYPDFKTPAYNCRASSICGMSCTIEVFVFRPSVRISMAQGLFKGGPSAGPEPTRARQSQIIPRAPSALGAPQERGN